MSATDAVVIIQARMGSSRLPGKVLRPIGDRPLLGLMLDRIATGGFPVVVATSTLDRDDPIERFMSDREEGLYRGSEHDVLQRVYDAAHPLGPRHVVRLTADCPLTDPGVIRACVALAVETGADYTSNTLIRTHPDGLDVEVLTAAALDTACAEAGDGAEREHVTPFLYRRPERFRLEALVDRRRAGHERWTVDTADDLRRLDRIVAALEDPVTAEWTDVHDRFQTAPEPHDLRLQPILAGDDAGPVSTPGARRWAVCEASGTAIGWIGVDVRGGAATLAGTVSEEHRAAALHALRAALTADAQVTRIDETWRN